MLKFALITTLVLASFNASAVSGESRDVTNALAKLTCNSTFDGKVTEVASAMRVEPDAPLNLAVAFTDKEGSRKIGVFQVETATYHKNQKEAWLLIKAKSALGEVSFEVEGIEGLASIQYNGTYQDYQKLECDFVLAD